MEAPKPEPPHQCQATQLSVTGVAVQACAGKQSSLFLWGSE